MGRVLEQTVTWRHRDTRKVSTVRYFVAATDSHRAKADAHATRLTQTEIDAIADYQKACEDGVAEIVTRPERKVVE